ncbi:LD-carboxypeptidase [Tissierella sp. P1]|uniref:S66 peptidase family protein n=1 Tax=unclassified Tissierella TaxID=2638726 RepID=UPI000BA0A846|nr:LD-carboxypeptidase [Tissierella sp. P1]MDU5083342.1 LD-carboxypeptidase [Bacillota bacterium]OZV10607.1 LD-carboxypeptidase [Tissierella sp. P1]
MIKPKALKLGDTIGIIAPASPTTEERVKKAHDKLIEMGFEVKIGKSPYEKYGYLSGTDAVRAEDINEMFKDKEVNGIICIRGGYGTPRILDLLDYEAIKNNPKVFVGYSDITALHIAFTQITDLVTYHGPMVASDMIGDFSEFSRDNLFKAIMQTEPMGKISNPPEEEIVTINGGIAEGNIIGGNLSLIVDTIGTPYEIDVKDKILFIEEIGEEPYNIDRMLNQLRLSGKLHDASGIILGDFNNCVSEKHDENLTLEQVIDDYIKPIGKPTIYNLQAGHCEPMVTLPFGVKARLDADKKELIILENCTE